MSTQEQPVFTISSRRELTETNIEQYETFLKGYSGYALRRVLTQMHKYLKADKSIFKTDPVSDELEVKHLINQAISQEQAKLPGVKTYGNEYSKLLLNSNNKFKEEEKPSYMALDEEGKKDYQNIRTARAIHILICIFSKYGGYMLDEDAATFMLGEKRIALDAPSVPLGETHTYLLRYWRIYLNYETEATVGTFYLTIRYTDHPTATLEDSNGDIFQGKLTECDSLRDGKMVSIIFSAPAPKIGQTFSLFFHKPTNAEFQNYIWASFAKERRQVAGAITTGLAYLETYTDQKATWTTSKPTPEIAYLLRRKRFDTNHPIDGDEKGISTYPTELHRFHGIYRGNLIKIANKGLSFETNIIVIRNDGLVVIYTLNSQQYPDVIYAGYCTVVNIQSKYFAAINFDLNDKRHELRKDFFKFSILLKEENLHRNKAAIQYLIGIRTGISQSDNNPITTKICLENINEEQKIELVNTFKSTDRTLPVPSVDSYLNKLIDLFFLEKNQQLTTDEYSKLIAIKKKLLTSLNFVDITGPLVDEKKTLDYFKSRPFLKKFFISSAYGSLTDTNAILNLKSLMPSNAPSGDYDCYSFSLDGNKPVLDYNNAEHERIKKYPIRIEQNGKAKIKIHRDVYEGKATYHEDRQELTLIFYISVAGKDAELSEDTVFFTCMLNVPKDAVSHKNTKFRLSGTLQKKVREKQTVESRVCVLTATTKPFVKNRYEDFIYFNSFAFRHRDKITDGILSHLIGPINRISRADADLKELHPRTQVNSFKLDLFYSACYIATLIKNSDQKEYDNTHVKQRLFQAYTHGFAQTHYRGISIESSTSNSNSSFLKKEIELLKNSMEVGKPLADEEIKEWINDRWFSSGDKSTLLNFLSSEESTQYNIVLPFQQHKTHIFPSDTKTADTLIDLFEYYGLNKPVSIQANAVPEVLSDNYCISVGLFSNTYSMQINALAEPTKNGRYFKLVDGNDPRSHRIRIMNTIDGNINDNEESWSEYVLDEDIEDYAIIAKVNYGTKKTLIVGGLNTEGTEMISDYLESSWQKLLDYTDLETSISVVDSDNFVCLLSLSKTGTIQQVTIRAISMR